MARNHDHWVETLSWPDMARNTITGLKRCRGPIWLETTVTGLKRCRGPIWFETTITGLRLLKPLYHNYWLLLENGIKRSGEIMKTPFHFSVILREFNIIPYLSVKGSVKSDDKQFYIRV